MQRGADNLSCYEYFNGTFSSVMWTHQNKHILAVSRHVSKAAIRTASYLVVQLANYNKKIII